MPKESKQQVIAEDLNLTTEKAQLPIYLIVDGVVSKSSLSEINKTKNWLYKNLNINTTKQLNNILLAIYDKQSNKILTTYKCKQG